MCVLFFGGPKDVEGKYVMLHGFICGTCFRAH